MLVEVKKFDNNSCMCRDFGNCQPKLKKGQRKLKLTHAFKILVSSASLLVVKSFCQFNY